MRVIFGGTFDPVHIGHLRMANELAEVLAVEKIHLMPCFQAVHKEGVGASSQHRLNMLALAVKEDSSLALDDRENRRGKESFTYDSLLELREEIGNESLCLVVGSDAANGLSKWFKVKAFSKLTNIIILQRPDLAVSIVTEQTLLSQLYALGFEQAEALNELKSSAAGRFKIVNLTQLDISSSGIRNRIRKGLSIRYLVTDAVRAYICDNALYQNQEK